MQTEKVSADLQNSLFNVLDACLKAIRRRNISYIIIAHSDEVATISLYVTGRKGMAAKDLVVIFDSTQGIWTALSQGTKYSLNSIAEITGICRSICNQLGTTVIKF